MVDVFKMSAVKKYLQKKVQQIARDLARESRHDKFVEEKTGRSNQEKQKVIKCWNTDEGAYEPSELSVGRKPGQEAHNNLQAKRAWNFALNVLKLYQN